MQLGLNLGYWTKESTDNISLATLAEQYGYAVVWVAEAYGSDAPTILSWLAAHTTTIDIGSAIMQIPARTPAMTAMTAATLDSLSHGRFRLGLGVSGPQVSEGWHGVKFAHPLERTREYIDIVNRALAGDKVSYAGKHYQLPLAEGAGKAMKLTYSPERAHIPIYLASIGPKNLELTGELCSGWLGILPTPASIQHNISIIAQGAHKAGKTIADIDIAPTIAAVADNDWKKAADATRGHVALYVGGMGSKKQNFYNNHICELGYPEVAQRVQELYLARDYSGAQAALPYDLLEQFALIGDVSRMADKLQAYAQAGVTTCNISLMPHTDHAKTLTTVAQACERAGIST